VRLQKLLARAGVASRRAAEELIRDGRVRVDGKVVAQMGVTVDPARAVVKVDGRVVRPVEQHHYFLLNKPTRVVCTLADPEGRRTVRDLLPPGTGRVYPVGRLDWDAEGVLLLTDDGDLAHRLMHPSYEVERTYHVKVKDQIDDRALERLGRGVFLDDGRARAEGVQLLRRTRENSWVSLTLREGRYHEVKRLCLAVGHPVLKIRRVSYAGLGVGRLAPGALRELTTAEVDRLRRLAPGEGGAGA
jgi:23S rRNA pseudouridine2605 synthase